MSTLFINLKRKCPFSLFCLWTYKANLSLPLRDSAPIIGVSMLFFPPLSSSDSSFSPPHCQSLWPLFQVTYLPLHSFHHLSFCFLWGISSLSNTSHGSSATQQMHQTWGFRNHSLGSMKSLGVGAAIESPCVFIIFCCLFPLAFEIYITPTSSHSPYSIPAGLSCWWPCTFCQCSEPENSALWSDHICSFSQIFLIQNLICYSTRAWQ